LRIAIDLCSPNVLHVNMNIPIKNRTPVSPAVKPQEPAPNLPQVILRVVVVFPTEVSLEFWVVGLWCIGRVAGSYRGRSAVN
jgi:hypothetical protein